MVQRVFKEGLCLTVPMMNFSAIAFIFSYLNQPSCFDKFAGYRFVFNITGLLGGDAHMAASSQSLNRITVKIDRHETSKDG
ncbi:hypothetical protein D918_04620 [Trichuris suis]|nr:hypothetical protein D918_04620 [Trichuris suis]